MTYRLLNAEMLESLADLRSAVSLRISLEDLAHQLRSPANRIVREDDSQLLVVEAGGVQFALVSYDSDLDTVHVFLRDSVARDPELVEQLLNELPIQDIEGAWWKRENQQDWPGNDGRSFFVNQAGVAQRITGRWNPSPPFITL
jgi:hypothetical protein